MEEQENEQKTKNKKRNKRNIIILIVIIVAIIIAITTFVLLCFSKHFFISSSYLEKILTKAYPNSNIQVKEIIDVADINYNSNDSKFVLFSIQQNGAYTVAFSILNIKDDEVINFGETNNFLNFLLTELYSNNDVKSLKKLVPIFIESIEKNGNEEFLYADSPLFDKIGKELGVKYCREIFEKAVPMTENFCNLYEKNRIVNKYIAEKTTKLVYNWDFISETTYKIMASGYENRETISILEAMYGPPYVYKTCYKVYEMNKNYDEHMKLVGEYKTLEEAKRILKVESIEDTDESDNNINEETNINNTQTNNTATNNAETNNTETNNTETNNTGNAITEQNKNQTNAKENSNFNNSSQEQNQNSNSNNNNTEQNENTQNQIINEPKKIYLPDLSKMSKQEAIEKIEKLGLRCDIRNETTKYIKFNEYKKGEDVVTVVDKKEYYNENDIVKIDVENHVEADVYIYFNMDQTTAPMINYARIYVDGKEYNCVYSFPFKSLDGIKVNGRKNIDIKVVINDYSKNIEIYHKTINPYNCNVEFGDDNVGHLDLGIIEY